MNEIITDYLDAKQLADRLTALELHSTSELARLEQERDEALSQIAQAECRAERFCQERDEARTDLEFRRGLYKVQEQYLETARRERDEARVENAKLRDIANRAINYLNQSYRDGFADEVSDLRYEIEQLKEGTK